jgi:glycerate 2-kinase
LLNLEVASEPRQFLLKLFQEGLAAVNGRSCVYTALEKHAFANNVYLVAIGKAADAMTAGAIDAINGRLAAGLVITRHGHQETPVYQDPRIVSLEAGHPLPDEQSLAAGNALRLFLANAPVDAHFLFLISGGASSLVEVPVEGVTLASLRTLTRWLLASGLSIDAVNRVRTAFSQIKGGRLLRDLAGRHAELLLISDVPGDVPAHIGSGLLLPAIPRSLPELPPQFADLPQSALPHIQSSNVHTRILATNHQAMQAVKMAATIAGSSSHMHDGLPAVDAAACGRDISGFLMGAPPGVHVWGGETTVQLPTHPGRGGRNQMLALAAAQRISGHEGMYILAAGTDGTDGNSCDAGALVDGGSITRGNDADFNADDCLSRADAGSFLEASGDLVYTGPTGTNVMDLVIALKDM